MKTGAKAILTRVNEGEPVITSIAHVSEVACILEGKIPLAESRRIISDIVNKRSVEVIDVSRNLYASSIHAVGAYDIGINDALAISIMKGRGVDEIYSFDKDLDNLPGIRRLHG